VRRLEGRDRDALTDAVAIAARFPERIEWARTEIRDIVQKPDLVPVALAELRAAIARDPGRADLMTLLSEVAFDAGEHEEAVAEARAADAASGGDGGILLRLAGKARAAGKGEMARAIAEELRQKHPTAPYRAELLLFLGLMHQEDKHPEEALAAYQEAAVAAAGSPDESRAHILAGRLHQTVLHDPAAALAEYEKVDAATLSPEDRSALLALKADGYLAQGDFSKAADAVDELAVAAQSDAARERAAFEGAEILFFQGRLDEAAAEYRALTQSFPSGDLVNDSIERLFLLQENAGAGEEAMRAFGRAEYQARIGETAGAVAGLRALAGAPGTPIADDARFRLATILIASGRGADGAAELHSLAVDLPASKYAPRALRLAGDALRDLGRPEDALGEYQILFSRYPQSLDADEIRPLAEELRKKVGS
jgi:tetratricopeptide (TPR) repeat protein